MTGKYAKYEQLHAVGSGVRRKKRPVVNDLAITQILVVISNNRELIEV